MGSGSSKLSLLSNKKEVTEKHTPHFKRLKKLKQEDILHLHDGCVSPQFGKSGLAFYVPVDENNRSGEKKRHVFENKPALSSEKHVEATLSTSLRSTAEERELLADIKKEEKLQEKARKAKMAEEKRLLVLQRREQKEREVREKYEAKVKKMEERKQEVQNRLRPPNSKVRSYHGGDTSDMKSKNSSMFEFGSSH